MTLLPGVLGNPARVTLGTRRRLAAVVGELHAESEVHPTVRFMGPYCQARVERCCRSVSRIVRKVPLTGTDRDECR